MYLDEDKAQDAAGQHALGLGPKALAQQSVNNGLHAETKAMR